MKPLKITLLLVVFVLCVSGNNQTNKENTQEVSLEELKKIDTSEFQLIAIDGKKTRKPPQNIM